MSQKQTPKIRYLSPKDLNLLPSGPGVYFFKKDREIFYIGKAVNIKIRVKNHFQEPTPKDRIFINQIKKIGFILTDSEIEALLLEPYLIKQYQPRFNVVWRDDKNFFYVGITKEEFSRVFLTHQPLKIDLVKNKQKEIEYIGPFVDGKALKKTLRVLRRIFPFRTCRTFPQKPCLWYELNQCLAPCLFRQFFGQINFPKMSPKMSQKISQIKDSYQKNIKNLILVLKGKKNLVLKKLTQEMKRASHQENFERAAQLRDQVQALENIFAHSHILGFDFVKENNWAKTEKGLKEILESPLRIERVEGYDVSNIQGREGTGSMVVFQNGKESKSEYRRFKIKSKQRPDDPAMIKEVLGRRFSHQEWPLPQVILIDGGKAQLSVAVSIKNKLQPSQKKNLKVVALAKQHNKLFVEGRKEILFLKDLSQELRDFLLKVRDEAHRFALKYHRTLRQKSFLR